MTETLHEYIVTAMSDSFKDRVEVGQRLYAKKYEGKERDWNYVNLDTLEPVGFITGLHRRKVTAEQLKAEEGEEV